jgi:3-isopropylmalate/(R)-2-methylmalate dehydratase small subunit
LSCPEWWVGARAAAKLSYRVLCFLLSCSTKTKTKTITMAASSLFLSPNPTFTPNPRPYLSHSSRTTPHFIRFPNTSSTPTHLITKPLTTQSQCASLSSSVIPRAVATPTTTTTETSFHGLCYVVGDNIDTDQIIPAEYLTLVPSNPAEYEKLGSYALIGLPSTYTTRFIEPNETKTKYSIVIGGYNFGCGSSREHAPVALGASGVAAVVAESYARIFFRNSVATGEVYPLESEGRICEECKTGDTITIELAESRLINHTTGKEYKLKPIGDAGPVIEAGGIFAYARSTGMIPSNSA